MTEKKAAEQFWVYALELYGQSTAREALLRLQDRDGADVPMLLWCVWHGAKEQGVSKDRMVQAVDFSKAWREETVEPLRKVRRALKSGIPGVESTLSETARSRIAETEQAVERIQMDHLAEIPLGALRGSAAENLDHYALVAGLSLDAADVSILVGMC